MTEQIWTGKTSEEYVEVNPNEEFEVTAQVSESDLSNGNPVKIIARKTIRRVRRFIPMRPTWLGGKVIHRGEVK